MSSQRDIYIPKLSESRSEGISRKPSSGLPDFRNLLQTSPEGISQIEQQEPLFVGQITSKRETPISMDKIAELQKSKLQQEYLAQLKYTVEFEKNLLSQVNGSITRDILQGYTLINVEDKTKSIDVKHLDIWQKYIEQGYIVITNVDTCLFGGMIESGIKILIIFDKLLIDDINTSVIEMKNELQLWLNTITPDTKKSTYEFKRQLTHVPRKNTTLEHYCIFISNRMQYVDKLVNSILANHPLKLCIFNNSHTKYNYTKPKPKPKPESRCSIC